MHAYKMMGLFVVEMESPAQARALYGALPDGLKAGCELTARMDGAQLRTPSSDAADWIASHYEDVRAA
jgi:hypothetical protein